MSNSLPTFRICDEKGIEVTPKVNDYLTRPSSAYFKAMPAGSSYNVSIYFGQTLAVQIPDSCIPMACFPSLRTDSGHYIYLTNKDSSNCYLNKMTLIFKHSKGLFAPLEVDFPFQANVNCPITNLIHQNLEKITYASIFQRIQKKFKIPPENLLLTFNHSNTEDLMTPTQSTFSSILQGQKTDIFMNNLPLFYDIIPTLSSPLLSTFIDESLYNRLKRFEFSLLKDFSTEFLSVSLPQILDRIYFELKTCPSDSTVHEIYEKSLQFVISNIFTYLIAPVLSSRYQIHPIKFFSQTWSSFLSNLSDVLQQLHILFGKDLSQLVLSDFYIYGLIISPFFIDRLFEVEKKFCSCEKSTTAKSLNIPGQILTQFVVTVGPIDKPKPFVVYLTRGFFYFYEGKTLNCALPLLSWKFVPCPNGYISPEERPGFCTGLFVNRFLSFYATFQSQTDLIDFWLLSMLCQNQLKNSEVRPLFTERLNRISDSPNFVLNLFFHFNEVIGDVNIINLSWTVRIKYQQICLNF